MALLNRNNFCRWLDPVNTPEFTIDGDFANGVSGTDLPDWNLVDTAQIGNDEEDWEWRESVGGNVRCFDVSQTNFDSKGLSQSLDIRKDKIYCFDVSIQNLRASDTTFYFFLGSQLVRSILVVNALEEHRFYVKADNNYDNVMLVAINDSDMIHVQVFSMKVYEFDKCFYTLPLFKSDGINIFVNAVLDNTVDVFSQLKVGLWNDNGIYLRDIVSLNQIVISGDSYSMFLDEWTVPVLPIGDFRFVIYDDSNGYDIELYLSNSFQRVPNTNFTSFVKYNNAADALGYLYESAPSFFNKFRVDLWTGRPNFNENVKGYETYEGDLIRVKSDIQKLVEFQTRFFDQGAHEAFFSMLSQSSIEIDGITYKKGEQSYDITWSEDDDNKIGTGIVNLLVEDYSAAIKTC